SRQISGEYRNEIRALKKVELLVLDDWGIGPLDSLSRGDLLEIVESRHESASTIVTSVLPVSSWESWIGDPTYADAILDRLTANPVRIELKGESMRSKQS
ncbi:MAG: ATP-binding protein, partial [Burkholderiales bacterium]|nr:ATP-binding protein [Burkholderiales bacterium]